MGIRIMVNGREYDGVESMPPEIKQLYQTALEQLGPAGADRDGNGVPDFAEGKSCCGTHVTFTRSIEINGQKFGGPEEMPADMRKLYEHAMKEKPEPTTLGLHGAVKPEEGTVEIGIRGSLLVVAGMVGAVLLGLALFRPR